MPPNDPLLVSASTMKKYILLWAQSLMDFRLQELQAVCELLDIQISYDASVVDLEVRFVDLLRWIYCGTELMILYLAAPANRARLCSSKCRLTRSRSG